MIKDERMKEICTDILKQRFENEFENMCNDCMKIQDKEIFISTCNEMMLDYQKCEEQGVTQEVLELIYEVIFENDPSMFLTNIQMTIVEEYGITLTDEEMYALYELIKLRVIVLREEQEDKEMFKNVCIHILESQIRYYVHCMIDEKETSGKVNFQEAGVKVLLQLQKLSEDKADQETYAYVYDYLILTSEIDDDNISEIQELLEMNYDVELTRTEVKRFMALLLKNKKQEVGVEA